MNKVILHISDLHVTMHKLNDQTINPKVDSYLTTNENETRSNLFIDKFIDLIKDDYKNSEFILVLTGDISNSAEIKEYDYAEKYICRILKGLNIDSKSCLLLPGDHDVHRRSIENELDINPQEAPYLLNEVKYKNFSKLYKNIKKAEFPFNKIIIEHLNIDSKILLLGINSNFKIGNKGGEGFIPIDKFKNELEELKNNLANDNLNYIAFWHHNISAGYDNLNSGQWESSNRKELLAELERQGIKFIFTGNEHTSNCKSILMGSITSSDSGALSSEKHDAAFKVYPIEIGENVKLLNKIYGLQKTGGNDEEYFWQLRTNSRARQPDYFEVFNKNNQIIEKVLEIPAATSELGQVIVQEREIYKTDEIYNNTVFSDKLYDIVKEKKLFHSGHFHWSETSRAHNWIDVSKMLEDNEDLYFAQNAIIDVIDSFSLNNNCDLVIGLGYEGNILSSKPSLKFNIPYASLPYSYRYNDHHDYEKKLNFSNDDKKFKKVLIITDVVNDGRTIRKLIAKREKEFFKYVNEIIVVSLFYTGYGDVSTDVLNYDKLPKNYDFENDHEVNNIKFYTVKSLRIEKCPYGKNFREECFIYKDDLSCVHLFYDERIIK